ncbi:RidA family protein [Rhodobacteraceae bacterium CCMM004]|nr:RidA family protein [Rhodobacteraceae bacterium CCMM004]
MKNPFPHADADRHEIWEMLVRRDIEARVAGDWELHAADIHRPSFFRIDARGADAPDRWRLAASDGEGYRAHWEGSVPQRAETRDRDTVSAALHDATTLRDIDVNGDVALAHKKMDGAGAPAQTLYLCRRIDGRWWIAGILGALPDPMGTRPPAAAKVAPPSRQHKTAGPYSPVLEVRPGRIVVISGQAALDLDGTVPTQEFKAQSRITLENCLTQLQAAGCDFADVFKVNVFLTDLSDWPAFNEVYREIMPEPHPVRTAVQAGLLDTFQVEIEMWAVRS